MRKFGPRYAKTFLRDRPTPSNKWHLDVLAILVHSRRDTRAVDRFFRKLFKQFGQPRIVITDKLDSNRAVLRKVTPGLYHRSHKDLNNRSEGFHRPISRRENIMGRFNSPGQAQRFFATHDQVQITFHPCCHTRSATSYCHIRTYTHALWGDITREIQTA